MKKELAVKEPNVLLEVGEKILQIEMQIKDAQDVAKKSRATLLEGMRKLHLKSLKLEDGSVFTIADGNRKVVIKDQEKAEKYLEDKNCWKLDSTKLLAIFGKELKVPPFFKIERGEEKLMILPPKAK